MTTAELLSLIQEEESKGNVVLQHIDGLKTIKIEDFVNQHTDGLLYDLNRDKATCMTLIDETGWINNYACALVIEYLKKKLEEYENK